MTLSLPDFSRAKVLIMGDVMLDRYWYGRAERISPEAPVPVVHVQRIEERPGGAGNVALNIASLHATVSLLGLTGADLAAQTLQSALQAAGVKSQLVAIAEQPTITKSRVIGANQQLLRLDIEQFFSSEDVLLLQDAFSQMLPTVDILVLSDYNKGTLANVWQWIKLAKQAGVPVLVDPKSKDFKQYQGASIVTPNRKEFEAVVGVCHTDADLVERGSALLRECDFGALLITRGGEGMTLLSAKQAPIHLPAHTHEVFDVTGAGDTVIGVLATALAVGESLPQAMQLANLAAGIVVTKLGAATVTPAELRSVLQHEAHCSAACIMTEAMLLSVVQDARSRGERIVMTNGCFDILHAGHVQYLQQAKNLGDRLLVAVNVDETVRSLKGEGRPINSLAERMAVLAGLEAVDWVVAFAEPTPARLIEQVAPDILVKGGDYTDIQTIAGAQAVLAAGGEVKILPFKAGCSTTRIIERVLALESDMV
jgi:D-beta-D-heptose 7-phosphate kinase / D-beta-D-heptose 1-phosphate adenosyltransferase